MNVEPRMKGSLTTWMPILVLALAACASTAELTPTPTEEAAVRGERVIDAVDGVQVTVEADAWPGPASVRNDVTPLKITLQNQGTEPVRFAYSSFRLVTAEGRTYAALPPFRAQEETARAPISPVGFRHHHFLVAPHLHPFYPSLSPFHHAFVHDPLYYDHYYDYWVRNEITMEEVRANAIPEGVLQPGGDVSGFLYFERVSPRQVERVWLRGDLISAETGRAFGSLSIPFEVSERA